MPWLPSHQELRDHQKTRKAAHLLGITPVEVIGHLHCLWWWALTYAPTGDLTDFDVTDLALGAEWEGDPDKFVRALVDCGTGDRSGFIDVGDRRALHDWGEYAGRQLLQAQAGERGNHVRWHEGRGRVEVDCPFCLPPESGATPTRIGGDIGGDSGRSHLVVKEEKAFSRARPLPSDWEPSEGHRRLAASLKVSLDVEAEQFKDHHRSKGSKFKDWDAAFRTWLRNAAKFRDERAPKNADNGSGFHAPNAAPA